MNISDLPKSVAKAMRLANTNAKIDMLPTGIPQVDNALGGGFGYGRAAELLGDWSTGKTMLLYYALAMNQKMGGISILLEAEGAFSAEFFRALGGNPDTLWYYDAETCEQVFEAVHAICELKKKTHDTKRYAVGWDSIACTSTIHLQEMDLEEGKRDLSKSTIMDYGVKKIRTILSESRVCFIATNQTREMIGSNDSAPHTPGGRAFPYLASHRVYLKFRGGDKTSRIYDAKNPKDPETIGRWVTGEVIKNKLAPPWMTFSFPIYTKSGFWHPEGYNCGTQLGIDITEGLFYSFLEKKILPPSKVPIISGGASGWYKFSEEVDPSQQSFTKKTWPEALARHPHLRNYVYAGTLRGTQSPTVSTGLEVEPQPTQDPGLSEPNSEESLQPNEQGDGPGAN